ncbi:HD-GYP domain-containing protein [Treponema phagedenis]|uniref:HD domain protein n=1 Tax=Treponema phagedenis TaxID=162 RepID=A0A0B7GXJ2_TREPH|nr:HD-GYP domain-containing protein [Treponema phagedenis]NVP23023.1 HD-GYP domain-containing protein [Treponema phagedenis]QEJ95143.1 HD-GYP domain-containing protein [Treponema phagedenis]QEJ98186.1 HD-GYP domain-containing protein [Treponema phagedenis]QEK01067.1 HD-GYP domain-containing protein [Treponema phagedenis]QEK03693.1 HD-GYP domain-containing protein [Treponema phagedenis]
MNTYTVSELKNPIYFSDDVYIDKKFLILIPEQPFTEDLQQKLLKWDFTAIYTDGNFSVAPQQKTVAVVAESSNSPSSQTDEKALAVKKEQQEKIQQIGEKYNSFQSFVKETYEGYKTKQSLNSRLIFDTAKELCEFIKEDKQLVLRLPAFMEYKVEDYLAAHSLRSAIFAIIIGLQLKMQPHKLIELAVATLLHEIGMMRIPEQVYMANETLNPTAQRAILAHPILSYNILKEQSFALPICLGALEHHERENGKGYPRKLDGFKISNYGKIIAVACSYEAATAHRPYKEAQNAASGIVNLIRNENKQYDESILRALLLSLSFYPIGIYVHLSNGKMAQVIDTNPKDPRYPIVQIYGETTKSGGPIIRGTSAKDVQIVRPVSKAEIEKMKQNQGLV